MDLTTFVASVEDGLAAAASAGDDHTRATAAALTAALGPALRLAIMDALSELALEVTDALGDRQVELRLESGEVRVAVVATPLSDDLLPDEAGDDGEPAEPSRITLRLPESLKLRAERAAAADGLSLNGWLTHAVQASLRGTPSGAGAYAQHGSPRLRGWVRG